MSWGSSELPSSHDLTHLQIPYCANSRRMLYLWHTSFLKADIRNFLQSAFTDLSHRNSTFFEQHVMKVEPVPPISAVALKCKSCSGRGNFLMLRWYVTKKLGVSNISSKLFLIKAHTQKLLFAHSPWIGTIRYQLIFKSITCHLYEKLPCLKLTWKSLSLN